MSDGDDNQGNGLTRAERSANALHKQTIGTTVAVLMFALASASALLVLGLGSGIGRIIGATSFLVGATIALVVVASTAKARSKDFTRRYLITIGVWGVLYAFFVVAGLTIFHPAPVWFWILGAVLVTLPELWFAYGSRSQKPVH